MLGARPRAIKTGLDTGNGHERTRNPNAESTLARCLAAVGTARVVHFSVSTCTNALMHLMHPDAPVAPDAP